MERFSSNACTLEQVQQGLLTSLKNNEVLEGGGQSVGKQHVGRSVVRSVRAYGVEKSGDLTCAWRISLPGV